MNSTAADFDFVEAYKDRFSITELIKHTQHLSRSGYYKRLKTPSRPSRAERDKELLTQMLSLYITHGGNLGNIRFKDALREKYQITVNEKRIQRMREYYNMPLKTKRRKPKKTGGIHFVCDNILNRNFTAILPGKKLCIDITYLRVTKPREKFIYLCAIIDLFNNEIIAYSIQDTMEMSLVFKTLTLVEEKGLAEPNAILHSDQGIQFTSPRYVNRLKRMNLIQSMSRRGNCWDNACIESFFGKLKTEMPGFVEPETEYEMIQAVTDYISYYNEVRPQRKLSGTPIAYRNNQVA